VRLVGYLKRNLLGDVTRDLISKWIPHNRTRPDG